MTWYLTVVAAIFAVSFAVMVWQRGAYLARIVRLGDRVEELLAERDRIEVVARTMAQQVTEYEYRLNVIASYLTRRPLRRRWLWLARRCAREAVRERGEPATGYPERWRGYGER